MPAPAAGLLRPADTVMDLNIGAALWLAAQGEGRVRLVPAGRSFKPATGLGALTCMLAQEAQRSFSCYMKQSNTAQAGEG